MWCNRLPPPANPSPTSSPAPVPEIAAPTPIKNQPFVPYSDDPPSSPDQDDEPDAHGMLEQQRLLMEGASQLLLFSLPITSSFLPLAYNFRLFWYYRTRRPSRLLNAVHHRPTRHLDTDQHRT